MAKKTEPKTSQEESTFKDIVIRNLSCQLTQEELEEKSEVLTGALMKIEELKEDLKLYSGGIKEKIKNHSATVAKLTKVVHDRFEQRDIDCEAEFDYKANRVTVMRLDTHEVFEDRDLAETEKQMQMQLENGEELGPDPDEVDVNKVEIQEDTAEEPKDKTERCPSCDGFKVGDDGVSDCDHCGGTGIDPDGKETEE